VAVAIARLCGIAPGALIAVCEPPQLTSNVAARLAVRVDSAKGLTRHLQVAKRIAGSNSA
jgi:hypothetical protein